MMGICTANTNFAVKMKEAMSTCKGETPIDMRAKKPSKGKGKGNGKGKGGNKPGRGKVGNKPGKCPTV